MYGRTAVLAGTMTKRTKVLFASAATVALGALILPRLARRIDSAVDPVWERAASNASQYQEMTNAFPIASEVLPDHPTRRLYEERKAALLAAAYIQTREVPLKASFPSGKAVNAFLRQFQSRFPGVEISVRGQKYDQPPLVLVTARKSDLGPLGSIEQFIRHYDSIQ